MQAILRESNLDLLDEVERLTSALQATSVVPELAPYHAHVLRACASLGEQIHRNLDNLALGQDELLPDILSETQRLALELKLYNQRLAGPALRGLAADRLPLRVIGWLHTVHEETAAIPAAVSTEEFGIWPAPPYPVVYFMPPAAQHSLLYQPLFFHEFGHLLYACHKPEMDSLVQDLQERISRLLEPPGDPNSRPSRQALRRRAIIVRTWHEWAQEFFCDVVGLAIGGPAFLHGFNHYLRMSPRTEYHCSAEELALRPHPTTWLRVHLLARRAHEMGCGAIAEQMECQWARIAALLGIEEDHGGFFQEEFLPMIWQTVDDMLVEASPRRFAEKDLGTEEWHAGSTVVHLVNRAWHLYQTDPDTYRPWERQAVAAFLEAPAID